VWSGELSVFTGSLGRGPHPAAFFNLFSNFHRIAQRVVPQLFGASLLQILHLARKSAPGEFFPLGLPRPRVGDGKFSDSTMPV